MKRIFNVVLCVACAFVMLILPVSAAVVDTNTGNVRSTTVYLEDGTAVTFTVEPSGIGTRGYNSFNGEAMPTGRQLFYCEPSDGNKFISAVNNDGESQMEVTYEFQNSDYASYNEIVEPGSRITCDAESPDGSGLDFMVTLTVEAHKAQSALYSGYFDQFWS